MLTRNRSTVRLSQQLNSRVCVLEFTRKPLLLGAVFTIYRRMETELSIQRSPRGKPVGRCRNVGMIEGWM